MNTPLEQEDCIIESLYKIEAYVEKATGIKPEPREIAAALSKYFVLKEILDFIQMERLEQEDED